ncbi:hypothetical protein BDQ17DRAFT_1389085 [Cyathus striatus]|nr:hypothetical protein BDQ17DRAFT_1389085 [Cyathus striatus]
MCSYSNNRLHGFLGAGKTSIILSLLPQLPKDYKVVLLKNEFGDIEVDSKLAQQTNLAGVSEILNGCMCCILVGQMENALLEIRLDSIVTVIDAENFAGYEDTSPTAKMQASYSDIILINKWEHISERALDDVIDHLNTLNDQTPKVRCQKRHGIDPNLIFGLESKLFAEGSEGEFSAWAHHDEVETMSIYRGAKRHDHKHHREGEECDCHGRGETETENTAITEEDGIVGKDVLISALGTLSKEVVWRVKGFVRLEGNRWYILNWAFGRFEITEWQDRGEELVGSLKLTVMGERGEVKRAGRRFAELVGGRVG